MYTSLLVRQIKKYLKEESAPTENFKEFLDAINRSYQHYERDHMLGMQSLEISTDEMRKLVDELSVRHDVTHMLLHATLLQDVLIKIAEVVACQLGWRYASFWLKEQGKELKLSCSYPSKPPAYLDELVAQTFQGGLQTVQETQTPFWLAKESHLYPDGQKRGITYVILPIIFEKDYFGALELFTDFFYSQDARQMHILGDVCTEIGLFMKQLTSQERERDLQKALIRTAREAGVTEVATSVLHNVGNVLNTINIAVSTLQDHLAHSEHHQLEVFSKLLNTHRDHLAEFVTSDPHGKYIPEYVEALANWWKKEYKKINKEIERLSRSIDHIKNIIKMQQQTAHAVGIKEEVDFSALVNELLTMHTKEFENLGILIQREYQEMTKLYLDREKLMQIIINLFLNAIDAMKYKTTGEKILTIRIFLDKERNLHLEVQDTGQGIDAKNLTKIFSFGFTTKPDGHGFGLHMSALLAQEMGGNLVAKSLGLDKGTSFILTIPIKKEAT